MAINAALASGLGCHEGDLPDTEALFHHFERAGISPDQVSPYTLLRCASLVITEKIGRGQLRPDTALDVYTRIHDSLVADTPVPSPAVMPLVEMVGVEPTAEALEVSAA